METVITARGRLVFILEAGRIRTAIVPPPVTGTLIMTRPDGSNPIYRRRIHGKHGLLQLAKATMFADTPIASTPARMDKDRLRVLQAVRRLESTGSAEYAGHTYSLNRNAELR